MRVYKADIAGPCRIDNGRTTPLFAVGISTLFRTYANNGELRKTLRGPILPASLGGLA